MSVSEVTLLFRPSDGGGEQREEGRDGASVMRR